MSFPKIVNQMGSLGEKRKKVFFRFCRPILDIFGFPLLTKPDTHNLCQPEEKIGQDTLNKSKRKLVSTNLGWKGQCSASQHSSPQFQNQIQIRNLEGHHTKRLDVKLTCVFDGLEIERKNKDRPVRTPVRFCGCVASSKPSNYSYGFLKNCFQQRLIFYETPVS